MSGLDHSRSAVRFIADPPIPGTFSSEGGTIAVTLCDVSVTGAQLAHALPLRRGAEGRLTAGGFEASAIVIWTRLDEPGRYRSGLRLKESLDVVAAAIRDLLARSAIRKEEDTQRRRERAQLARAAALAELRAARRQGALSQPLLQMIRATSQWFNDHPDEAVNWYRRARMTATSTQLEIAGSGRVNRDDVLAVWEYLERRVALADVVRALERAAPNK